MLRRVRGTGSAADVWSGASYERLAETFAPIHDRIVALLAPAPESRLLDVACGTGGVALRAARTGADVVGIDISAEQIEKARRAAADAGLAIRFDEGDAQELPYAGAEFDVVASAFAWSSHPTTSALPTSSRGLLARWPAGVHRLAKRRLVRPARDGRPHPLARGRRPRVVAGGTHTRAARGGIRARIPDGDLADRGRVGRRPLGVRLDLDAAAAVLARAADAAARGHAERVYREFLEPGYFEREYRLVLGTRR
jgi:SAM-dependent methyltransferase